MSRIEKLSIRGIRSFDPQEEIKIEFFQPLTLIQGHNGSGKTTIIECLKMASCGSLPPLATNGKTFICDPKITKGTEVKASIKLKFLTPRDKEVLIIRNFQLCLKNNKYEFKRLEQLLKSHNSAGELVTINSTCIDIDKQVPLLMHASKAIIENVIFCHQEETSWPFSEPGYLKKVFDEIFDTAKYTKALEELKDLNKEYSNKTKELKNKIELTQKDYEQFKKINQSVENFNKKIEEINIEANGLKEDIEKTDKELKQIIEYEEKFNKKKFEVTLMKTRYEEKTKQIENIKSDPYFTDYTTDEITYQNFIRNYNSNPSELNERSAKLRNEIESLNLEFRNTIAEINKIHSVLGAREHLLKKFNLDKQNIIEELNQVFPDSFNMNMGYDEIISQILLREQDIISKLNMMDDKKKNFENKINEKFNENEINRCLIENKQKEIDILHTKRMTIISHIQNFQISMERLENINQKIIETQNYIKHIENSEVITVEKELDNLEKHKNILNESISKYPDYIKNEDLAYSVNKLKESLQKSDQLNKNSNSVLNYYSNKYKESFATLDVILFFINKNKNEITEQKQIIREQNYLNSHQIYQKEDILKNFNNKLKLLTYDKDNLLEEISHLFDKFNISYSRDNFSQQDLNKLLIMREELTQVTNNLNEEKNSKMMERGYLQEYIQEICEGEKCPLCDHDIKSIEMNSIRSNINEKIEILKDSISKITTIIEAKEDQLSEIDNCEMQLNRLKSIIDEMLKVEEEKSITEKALNDLYSKRKNYENNSKETTTYLMSFESLNIEEIFKLKSEVLENQNEINNLNKKIGIQNISQNDQLFNQINECNSVTKRLNEVMNSIQEVQIVKSQIYERLNRLNNQLRLLENEKANINRMSNNGDMNDKIAEFDNDINTKINEKEFFVIENEKINELKDQLISKKKEFDSLYFEKYPKYKAMLDRLNITKVKIQYSINESNNLNNTDSQILNQDKLLKEDRKSLIEKEIFKLQEEYNYIEVENKKKLQIENVYKNNITVYNLKKELAELNSQLEQNKEQLQLANKIAETKSKITTRLNLLNTKYNINIGKLSELNNCLNKLNSDIKNDLFFDIEGRYNKLKMEYILSLEVSKNIDSYYEALDYSLLKYHSKRMEEINKLINYYWNMTYKGSDIKWIEIRSDVEKTSARSRSYNYRIVFGTNGSYYINLAMRN